MRVIATAGSLTPARFSGAEPERSQQVALRAKYQIHALPIRKGHPLFESQPARKTAFANLQIFLRRKHRCITLERIIILPRDSGEGGPRSCAVEGARAVTHLRQRQRSSHSDAPPPCFAWSPSPAIAGADEGHRSRDALLRPSHSLRFKKAGLERTGGRVIAPTREAERRAAHLVQ